MTSGFADRNKQAIQGELQQLDDERRASKSMSVDSLENGGFGAPKAKSGIGTVRFDLGGGIFDERDAEELEDDPIYGGIASEALFKRAAKTAKDEVDSLSLELQNPNRKRLSTKEREEILAAGSMLQESDPQHVELKKRLIDDDQLAEMEKRKFERQKQLQELGSMGVNGFRQKRLNERMNSTAQQDQQLREQEAAIAAKEATGVTGSELEAHAAQKAQIQEQRKIIEARKQQISGILSDAPQVQQQAAPAQEIDKETAAWKSMKTDERLAKKLQDFKLFSSLTQSIGIASDKSLKRRPDGTWDTPAVVKQYDNQVFNALKSGLTAVRAKVGMRGGGTTDETQAMNEALYQFQQENNLSDEEVVKAWNDFTARNNESWQDGEKLRVLSDGEIVLNATAPEILDRNKLSQVIQSANAPDEQKARALENLDFTRKNVAEQRMLAYEAAGIGIESPSEYAARTGRNASVLSNPDFILEYEQNVINAEGEVAKKARGLAADVVLGFNKLATGILGVGAQITNSETLGQLAAEGSEGGQVVAQGKPDTGLIGAVIQEAPSLGAMVVGSQLIGAGGAAAGLGATALSWMSRAGSLLMAGGQSLGATYADERAQGKTHEEAEEVALRSGINTALITGIFNALPGMAGFEKYTGGVKGKVADVTMREILKSTSKKELAKRVASFTKDKLIAGASEGLEEGIDELTNAFINADPDTNLSTAWQNAAEAAKVGAFIGAGVDVISSTGFGAKEKADAALVTQGKAPITPEEERKLAEVASQEAQQTPERAVQFVSAMREIGEAVAADPENGPLMGARASGSLKIASGKTLDELTTEEINALGIKRDGSPMGGDVQPLVDVVNGTPVLLDAALRELEGIAPSAKGLVSMTEGEARAKFSKTTFSVTSRSGQQVEVQAKDETEAQNIAAGMFQLGDTVETVTPVKVQTAPGAKGKAKPTAAATPAGTQTPQPGASLATADILSRVTPEQASSAGLQQRLQEPELTTSSPIKGLLGIRRDPDLGGRLAFFFDSAQSAQPLLDRLTAAGFSNGINQIGNGLFMVMAKDASGGTVQLEKLLGATEVAARKSENSQSLADIAIAEATDWDTANRARRASEWHEGGHANMDAIQGYRDAEAAGGMALQAHGMAKESTLSGGIKNLLGLLTNGLDMNRRGGRLDTANLVAPAGGGLVGATASGTAYKDGPFTLVARPGESLSGDLSGLGAVIINQANEAQADSIKKAIQAIRPDIVVGTASELGSIVESLLGSQQSPTAAPAPAKLSPEGIKKLSNEELAQAEQEYATTLRNNVTDPDPAGQEVAKLAQEGLNRIRAEIARRSKAKPAAAPKVPASPVRKAIEKSRQKSSIARDQIVETNDPKVMMQMEDDKILINPEAVEARAKELGLNDAGAAKWIDGMIDEEVRHIVQRRAARELHAESGSTEPFQQWLEARYKRIWQEEFVAKGKDGIVRQLYGPNLSKMPEWKRAMEGERMLWQQKYRGQVTEVARLWLDVGAEVLENIRALLKQLKALVNSGELSGNFKADIARLEAKLKEIEEAAARRDAVKPFAVGETVTGAVTSKDPQENGAIVTGVVAQVGNGFILVRPESGKPVRMAFADVQAVAPKAENQPEWVSFDNTTGTLGIPRAEMPQIKAEDRSAMVQFLKARGIDYQEENVAAGTLKPTQAEYSPAKVQQAREYEGRNRAILVSADNHVVDGHHQWLAADGGEIRVIRLMAPIRQVLDTVKQMPSATTDDGGKAPEALTATLSFPSFESAQAFAKAWARYSARGNDMSKTGADGSTSVTVYGVTDADKQWIDSFVASQQAPAQPEAETHTFYTPNPDANVVARGTVKIVSAAELERMVLADVSANQARLRTGQNANSSAQVAKIAADPKPQLLLGVDSSVSEGAPTVYDGEVLAGNGRSMGIIAAYKGGTAERYKREALAKAKQLGITIDPSITDPVLIRSATRFEGGTAQDFADQSNSQGMLGLSAVELAKIDAQVLGDFASVDTTEAGDFTAATIRDVAAAFDKDGRNKVTRETNGQPNAKQVADRIRSAALAGLFDKAGKPMTDLLGVMESDEGARLVSIIAANASRFMALDNDLSLATELTDALIEVQSGIRAVAAGTFKTLREWQANQGSELIGRTDITDAGLWIAGKMVDAQRKPSILKEIFAEYLNNAETEQQQRDEAKQSNDIFGEQRQPQNVLASLIAARNGGAASANKAESLKGEADALSNQGTPPSDAQVADLEQQIAEAEQELPPQEPSKPKIQLTDAEKALEDASEGLFASDLGDEPTFSENIPAEKMPQMITAATAMIKGGVETPDGMANSVVRIEIKNDKIGALRRYSESIWSMFRAVKNTLQKDVDWAKAYAKADADNGVTKPADQTKKKQKNDKPSSNNLESDRGDARTGDGGGQDQLPIQPGATGATGGRVDDGGEVGENAGSSGPLSARVPSSADGVAGITGVPVTTSKPRSSTAGGAGPGGRSGADAGGVSPEPRGQADTTGNLTFSLVSDEAVGSRSAQSQGEQVTDSPLTPEQQGDVDFAKRRLYDAKKPGVLFTNGTGTGKTFTGLGVIKDALDSGAKNILVVAPSDKVGSDWKATAQDFFGITDVDQLSNTNDNGAGNRIVITTYANFGQNTTLVNRDWDMIVTDESHYLGQSKEGSDTDALDALRALTWHKKGLRHRAFMMLPPSLAKELTAINQIPSQKRTELQKTRRDAINRMVDSNYADLKAQAKSEADRPKTVFLSATPFAYHFSLDYAEGYLFDFGAESENRGYNTPSARDRFYVENFGYRMRYNRLTVPDAAAATATGIMERRFAEKLMKEGAMSGRALKVDRDYSRQFVLTETEIGTRIDEIMKLMTETPRFAPLRDFLGLGDFLARRYLLEGIKARESVKRIKQHLDLGRKVVVFHDYKKGGAVNPLIPKQSLDVEIMVTGDDGKQVPVNAAALFNEFKASIPDYDAVKRELDGLLSPIEMIQREFPENGAIFNGSVSKGNRRALVKKFNKSGSGLDVLLVQRASGKEGISLHDTDAKHQRAFIDIGMPARPTDAIQGEGRIYRFGVKSDAVIEYLTTGTNTERWTFAQTIAQRSSTAENLAMGEAARALLQSYATGYNNAEAIAPSMEQGKGGKEMDRARLEDNPYEVAKALYFTNQKKTSKNKAQEGVDYFATPEPLGYKMVEWADIQTGEKVLEPSGGHGAIARFFPDSTNRHAVEPSNELAGKLALNATDTQIHNMRFEDYNVVNKFNAVVMNPPFGTAGKTAMEHLVKALSHLRNGGRVVALIPNGSSMAKRFDQWYESDEAKGFYLRAEIQLPSVTFERAGTSVSARIIIIDKVVTPKGVDAPSMPQVNRDLSNAATVQELFDRLQDMTMPQRVDVSAYEADKAQEEEAAAATNLITGGRGAMLPKPESESNWSPAEFKHTKTGAPIFVAKIMRKLSRPEYEAALVQVKAWGGRYSNFKGNGAIPGFHFDSAEARDAFMNADMPGDTSLQASDLAPTPPPFYSQLSRVIDQKMPATANVGQVMQIAMQNAKSEEVKWSGLQQALVSMQDEKGKVTKEAVLKYLADEGAMRFEEVTLSSESVKEDELRREAYEVMKDFQTKISKGKLSNEDSALLERWLNKDISDKQLEREIEMDPADFMLEAKKRRRIGKSKYSQYTLPGGENYREVVLAMPDRNADALKRAEAEYRAAIKADAPVAELDVLSDRVARLQPKESYTSRHFPDVPNYVAHMRLNERDNGLFIEELQSDRHQAGRKKGYQSDEISIRRESDEYVVTTPIEEKRLNAANFDNSQQAVDFVRRLTIPDAPFRTTWPLALFKRALRDAVASGKEWIGWTTGETQNERFDLSKQVDSIGYLRTENGVNWTAYKDNQTIGSGREQTESQVADYLGKDIARKMMEGKENGELSGLDLKVGGTGMKGFYDNMLPKEIGKYVKQWGGKAEKKTLSSTSTKVKTDDYDGSMSILGNWSSNGGNYMTGVFDEIEYTLTKNWRGKYEWVQSSEYPEPAYFASDEESDKAVDQATITVGDSKTPIWRVDITPEMRESVQAGQALFASDLSNDDLFSMAEKRQQEQPTKQEIAAFAFTPEAGDTMKDVKVGRMDALRAYRTLTTKRNKGGKLTAEEEQQLLDAEAALGQKMAFDMDAVRSAIPTQPEEPERKAPRMGQAGRGQQQEMLLGQERLSSGQMTLFASDLAPYSTRSKVPAGTRAFRFPGGILTEPTDITLMASDLEAWHGTPHKVDKFKMDKIGTGEGAQAYGHGLYFAESANVANTYRVNEGNDLPEKWLYDGQKYDGKNRRHTAAMATGDGRISVEQAIQNMRNLIQYQTNANFIKSLEDTIAALESGDIAKVQRKGNIYRVRLKVDDKQLLDWDKPMSEQSLKVRQILKQSGIARYLKELESDFSAPSAARGTMKRGHNIYSALEYKHGSAAKASKALLDAGIKGIAYLDGNSRSANKGTSNYVIFNENDIEILEENGQPVSKRERAALFASDLSADDAAYMAAVEAGDMETAQRMVDEAARAAGYNVGPAYHNSPTAGIKSFMPFAMDLLNGSKTPVEVRQILQDWRDRAGRGENAGYMNYRAGTFFSTNETDYKGYGENQYRVFLKVQNALTKSGRRAASVEREDIPYDALYLDMDGDGKIEEIAIFDPNQIKSADPVTYDANGNVIPLSQRFNPASDSILYASDMGDMNPDRIKEIMAQQEEFGNAVRPGTNRASVGDEATRKVIDVFDIDYEERRMTQTRDQWVQGGQEKAANNRKALIENAKLLAAGAPDAVPLTPADIVGTQIVIEQMVQEAGDNFEKLMEAGTVIQAYRKMRGDVARVLASGWDRMMKPAERHRRFLANAILTLPTKVAAEIDRSYTPDEARKVIRKEITDRLRKIERALNDMGVTVDEVLGKQFRLSPDKRNILKDIVKDMSKAEQRAMQMHSEHVPAEKIMKETGLSRPHLEQLVKKSYDDALARMIEKVRAGMTAENAGVSASALMASPLNMTEDEIIAEAKKLVELGLGLSPNLHTAATKPLVKRTRKPENERKAVEVTAEQVAARWALRLERDKQGVGKNVKKSKHAELVKLIRAHTKREMIDFKKRAMALGVSAEQATLLDVECREARARAKMLRYENVNKPQAIKWARPEFNNGLIGYDFAEKDLAAVKKLTAALTDAVQAVGKVESLSGSQRAKAEAMLAKLDEILAKYGTSAVEVANSGKPLESYRFDIEDPTHVHVIANAILAIDADFVDKAIEYNYFSLLSGPQTFLKNATSIFYSVWDATIARGFEAMLNTFLKNPMNASLGESKYILRAMGPMLSRAKTNFIASFGAEMPFFEQDILGVPPDLDNYTAGIGSYHRTAISGRKGRLLRIPTRALLATDDYVKTINACAEVGAMAYRICRAAGLKPDTAEFDQRMKQLVNVPGSMAWRLAAEKGYRRTFTNALPGQKDQSTGQNRPVRTGGEVVGMLVGKTQNLLNTKTDKMAAKVALTAIRLLFFPFVKVPYNIIATALSYTPLSLIEIAQLVAQSSGIKNRTDKMKAQAEVIERMTRTMQGSILMAFVMGALGEGDDDDLEKPLLITGSRPFGDTKAGVRETAERLGVGPYTISWPMGKGKRGTFNYGGIEPLATILGTTVDASKEIKQAMKGRQTYSEALSGSFGSFANQISEKSFMQGVGDLFKLWKGEQDMTRFAADALGRIVPNIIKQPARELDPYARARTDELDKAILYAMFPVGQKEAKTDIYGEPIKKGGFSIARILDFTDAQTKNTRKVDEMMWRYMQRNPGKDQLTAPTEPGNTYTPISGKGSVKMTDNQTRMYRELAGRMFDARVKSLALNYENPTESDMKKVKAAADAARDTAKKALQYNPNWK